MTEFQQAMAASALALLLIFWIVGAYNRLIRLRTRVKTSFAQIYALLVRRYELIPELVEVARAGLPHESGALDAVMKARNSAVNAAGGAAADPADAAIVRTLAGAEATLASTLGRLIALADTCPALRARPDLLHLFEQLVDSDNRITFARQDFNERVTDYAAALAQFPGSIIANMFGLRGGDQL